MHKLPSRSNRPLKARKGFWPLIVVVGLCLLVLTSELAGITHIFHHKKISSTGIVQIDTAGGGASNSQKGETTGTKGTSPTSTSSSSSQTVPTQPSSNKSLAPSSSATLIIPSGDFVSFHDPNLSNKPRPNTLSSVCTTTPGAACTIVFTKDTESKALPSQITDSNGSSYWNNWTLQSIGLTAGSWQIQAVATLNGQTKSATDAMNLVVSQ